jgi:hypothetical protein
MTIHPSTVSVRSSVLGADPAQVTDEIAGSLRAHGLHGAAGLALGRLGSAGLDAVDDQVAEALESLLEASVGSAVGAAWTRHTDLRSAARRTLASPGAVEVIDLADHEVTSVQRPHLELLVDGVPRGRLEVQIVLRLLIEGALAVVREGRLVELRSGRATGTVQLWVLEAKIAERRVQVPIPGIISLGAGLPLADPP